VLCARARGSLKPYQINKLPPEFLAAEQRPPARQRLVPADACSSVHAAAHASYPPPNGSRPGLDPRIGRVDPGLRAV